MKENNQTKSKNSKIVASRWNKLNLFIQHDYEFEKDFNSHFNIILS